MEQTGGNTAGYPQAPVLLIAGNCPSGLRAYLPVNARGAASRVASYLTSGRS
jgi:hypothetical protein